MARVDPQRTSDYDDRTTRAVKAVLLEIGQLLGSFRGKFVVIGGAVPWLQLPPRHRRTPQGNPALHGKPHRR